MWNSLKEKGKAFLNIIKPRTRLGLLSAILLCAGVFFALFVYGAPALAGTLLGVGEDIIAAIANVMLWVASKFLSLAIFILGFVIEIASYNNYINSSAVILGWVLVRDLTNMFFVIILMVIAFGTVLGIEQYEWRKMLVKFVLAAILVNFSRIICGVIIDAAQVFMMTFISGVAAVGGGNLLSALKLGNIMEFAKNENIDPASMGEVGNIVASTMIVLIFAFASMIIIGAYLIVLLGRVIALWVLIILSPLAFVLGVIPKFQSYAGEWWTQFSNYVISGPVLAFFLWLSFAVAGGGTVHETEFGGTKSAYRISDLDAQAQAVARDSGEGGSNLNQILETETLASFIIAAALLMAGVKVTQRLAGVGAGVLGAAAGAVGKFATVASGVAAARWAYGAAAGAAAKGAKAVGKGVLMKAPLVGGEAWMRRGRAIKAKAKLVTGEFQKGREQLAAGMMKKGGVGGALAGTFLATGKQKERRVKFLEGAAESLDKEREESLGVGTLKEGLLSGRYLKSYELAKKKADEDKEIGLMIPLEQLLREQGRGAEAEVVLSKRTQLEIDRNIREAGSMKQLRDDIEAGKRSYGKDEKGEKATGAIGLSNLDNAMKIAQRQIVRDEDLAIDRRTAEGAAKARYLEDEGRFDEANIVKGAVAALENKRWNEGIANLDTNELIAMFNNKMKRLVDINNKKKATTDKSELERLDKEHVKAARDMFAFRSNTMDNEFVRQHMFKEGAKASHYDGTNNPEDFKKFDLSILTGINANNADNHAEIDKILGQMNDFPGMQEMYKRRALAADRVAAKGDFREVVIMDKGLNLNARTGQFEIVRGQHKNLGNYKLDGTPQLETENAFEVDQESIKNYKKLKMDLSTLVNAEIVFSGFDDKGNVTDVSDDIVEGFGNTLSQKSEHQIKSAISKMAIDRWNDLADKGKMTEALAQKLYDGLINRITNVQAKQALAEQLGALRERARREIPKR